MADAKPKRIVLERWEGGSSTADLTDRGMRLSSRIGGKTEQSFSLDPPEVERIRDLLAPGHTALVEAMKLIADEAAHALGTEAEKPLEVFRINVESIAKTARRALAGAGA